MKHRHLTQLGFRVISVSYREWEEAGGGGRGGCHALGGGELLNKESAEEGRRALLARKLSEALDEALSC
jgi:hypothetical protein